MSDVFHVPDNVVNKTLESMKNSYLIHPEAAFNYSAENGMRKEVTYGDLDFKDRIGRTEFEEETIDAALDFLKRKNLVGIDSCYNKKGFSNFREYHKRKMIKKSWTSLSPTMERMFFMLTSVKKPKSLIELGCFWGNTLAWFVGPCIGPDPLFKPRRIIGIDIDAAAMEMALENFRNFENTDTVQLIIEDARQTLNYLDGQFDFVYIEAKTPDQEDLYLQLLQLVYDKIPKGGWVMAHDATRYSAQDELRDYLRFVRDKSNFQESISFDIDAYGLELSIK
jgi:predicted O-methyltransferase YrrM